MFSRPTVHNVNIIPWIVILRQDDDFELVTGNSNRHSPKLRLAYIGYAIYYLPYYLIIAKYCMDRCGRKLMKSLFTRWPSFAVPLFRMFSCTFVGLYGEPAASVPATANEESSSSETTAFHFTSEMFLSINDRSCRSVASTLLIITRTTTPSCRTRKRTVHVCSPDVAATRYVWPAAAAAAADAAVYNAA